MTQATGMFRAALVWVVIGLVATMCSMSDTRGEAGTVPTVTPTLIVRGGE